jgi:hypothetical protein
MKFLVYLLSGAVFGLGLSISGMIDPLKVKSEGIPLLISLTSRDFTSQADLA